MNWNYFGRICCALLMLSTVSQAKIVLPHILGHDMVVQQDKPIAVWGWAEPGEQIIVTFAGHTAATKADDTGAWKLSIHPVKATFTPQYLTVKGATETIVLHNILVGEVWVCSGQSNMEYAMRKLEKLETPHNPRLGDSTDAYAKASNTNIRLFLVNRKTLPKPDSLHNGWDTAIGTPLRDFSAAGYFFAEELYNRLHVPIGMVSSAVPGSAIEPWMPEEAMTSLDYFKGQKIGQDPGKFYYTMIKPMAPLTIRGFLWYQGETNSFLNDSVQYYWKMKGLINSWRETWGDKNLSFYFTQITPFLYADSKGKITLSKEEEPRIWEAQQYVYATTPHTGMTSTNDLTDSVGDLHPTYKWEIGRRLALWALAKDYGKDIVYSGPMYKGMKTEGDKIIISFTHTGSGLVSEDGASLKWFTIAGKDGVFVPATAEIVGEDKVAVSAPGIRKPQAVRFCWEDGVQHNLFNKEGLPAISFRTDSPYKKMKLK